MNAKIEENTQNNHSGNDRNNNNTDEARTIIQTGRRRISLKIAMVAMFTALGVVLSYLNPFAYFTIFGTKIDPFAHIINAMTGVLLGPIWAVLVGFLIAIIRFSLQIGSIYAFPGGMAGGLVVGIVAVIISKKYKKHRSLAGLSEPIGTVFLGGTISVIMSFYMVSLPFVSLTVMWGLFAASCIPGAIIGYLILKLLERKNITYLNFK